jgi:hypothetical protein
MKGQILFKALQRGDNHKNAKIGEVFEQVFP